MREIQLTPEGKALQEALRQWDEANPLTEEEILKQQRFAAQSKWAQESLNKYPSKVIDQKITDSYAAYHGDCVHVLRGLPDNSIHCSIFSPPFPLMYTYSNSKYDMGNVTSIAEMLEQCRYMMEELFRCMVPGRSVFVHLTQGVAQKLRDGYIGIKDLRGPAIKMAEECGFNFYSEITIDKNAQVKSIRTRDVGLAFKSLVSDSAQMHSALSDFVLHFRKPGENPVPVKAGGASKKYPEAKGWITPEQWILWARPVWYGQDYLPGTSNNGAKSGIPCPKGYGIQETDTLSTITAKDVQDEKHLCALQLPVIERLVLLHTNPGEIVHDPFGGIGSTGYVALKHRRKAVLSELKASYYKQLVKNLDMALAERNALTLFDLDEAA